ncbi:MAG: hypothetical protein JXA43_02455 [Candidatus Diapherotrites archaeon]|nr:hypothetical protein [Candidatus Diapherotrites archaeon]
MTNLIFLIFRKRRACNFLSSSFVILFKVKIPIVSDKMPKATDSILAKNAISRVIIRQ